MVYILSIFLFSFNIYKLYGVCICVENKSLYLEVGWAVILFIYLFSVCFCGSDVNVLFNFQFVKLYYALLGLQVFRCSVTLQHFSVFAC